MFLIAFSYEESFAGVGTDYYRCPPAKGAWPELIDISHTLLIFQQHDADAQQAGTGMHP